MDWIGLEQAPVASYCNQDFKYWSSVKHGNLFIIRLTINFLRWTLLRGFSCYCAIWICVVRSNRYRGR